MFSVEKGQSNDSVRFWFSREGEVFGVGRYLGWEVFGVGGIRGGRY